MKKKQNSYRFFRNTDCEYYPCHKGLEELNCLFCFCPLYPFSDCGGDYSMTDKGIKSCEHCTFPHRREHYDLIMEKLIRLSHKT